MHLVARKLTPDDYPHMVRLCQWEEVRQTRDLKTEWENLWGSGGFMGVALEDLDRPAGPSVVSLMACVFLEESYWESCLIAYEPFLVSQLAVKEKGHPILTEDEVGARNAGNGLHLLVCYLGWPDAGHGNLKHHSLRALAVNAFGERFGGHKLRSIIGEVAGPTYLEMALRTGCSIFNDYHMWAETSNRLDDPHRPILIGATRDEAFFSENPWFGKMFTYVPPRFMFTDHQRDVLVLARDGMTDQEIASILGVSLEAVKKRWGSVYERVNEVLPMLLPESPEGGRGQEKRRALLAHLRDRPEELRPYGGRAVKR